MPKDQFTQKDRSSGLKKAYIFPVAETNYEFLILANVLVAVWDFAWTNPPKNASKCFSNGIALQNLR